MLVCTALYVFFRTNLGTAMQAAGDNPQMIRALGVNVENMIVLGLMLSNALVALAGALLAQYQGFADVQMGIGMVVWGLASVIIGEALVGTRQIGFVISRRGDGIGPIPAARRARAQGRSRPERPEAGHRGIRFPRAHRAEAGRSSDRAFAYAGNKGRRTAFGWPRPCMTSATRRRRPQRMAWRAMLEVERLSKTFNPDRPNEVRALQGVSLTIDEGSFVVVIGTNGSGKSTLLNAVAGTFLADDGRIRLNGVDVTRWPEHRRAALIGRVFQNPFSGTAAVDVDCREPRPRCASRAVARTGVGDSQERCAKSCGRACGS